MAEDRDALLAQAQVEFEHSEPESPGEYADLDRRLTHGLNELTHAVRALTLTLRATIAPAAAMAGTFALIDGDEHGLDHDEKDPRDG